MQQDGLLPESERLYNARLAVPQWPRIFERWARDSAAVRASADRCRLDLRYGPQEMQTLDLFLPQGRPLGTLMYIHGGYWRSLDKSDASIVAPPFTEAGYAVAVINYALCPAVSVGTIVDQVRAAAAWLHADGAGIGGPTGSLFACGHSAGGHLAAMLLATDWPQWQPNLPAGLVAGAICISGLYDLQPLLAVPSVMQAARLTPESARALSPKLLSPQAGVRLVTAIGLDENRGFHEQLNAMVDAWPEAHAGHVACAGRDHFTILEELTDRTGAVAAATLRLMRSSATSPAP